MDLKLLLSVVAAVVTTADCTCYSTTLYATTSRNSKTVYSSSYDYCTIKIRPSSYSNYGSSYYLEISWSSSYFNVKGDMPFCKSDYVEVFLTSSYRSIGKFCSNNAGKPFTMYSEDRYAKIVYSTDGHVTGSEFTFYYQLKDKTHYPLGGYASSSCYNRYNFAASGVIYSTGWPLNYKQSSSSCNFRISRKYGYQGAYVVFMDLNMYSDSYSEDCVQLFASNYSTSYYEKTISTRLCGINNIKMYKTYSRYLLITFNRNYKPNSTYRGFVAGYVMFKRPTGTAYHTTKTSFNSTGIVQGVVIPIVIIAIIIIAVVVYTKKKKRPTPGFVHNGQSETAAMVSTQQTTTQQTPQIASSMPNANCAYNKTQYVYPTATMQGYPQGSYPLSYATGPTYPTGQYTTSPYPAPQLSFMVAPTYSSAPVGAVQPSLASGYQEHQPSGALQPSSDGTAPPPSEAPNIPPLAYQAAISS